MRRAGESAVSSVVLPIILLMFEEVAGGRHRLLFLFLNAHPLALTLAFATILVGRLDLMSVLSRVRGNARVRVENGEVGIPGNAVVLPGSTAPFLGLTLQGGLAWWSWGRRRGGGYCRLLDQ